MKKALTLAVLIVTPSIIFAQETVGFANNSRSLVQQWTSAYYSTPAPVPVGGGYVQLIATAKGNPLPHPLGVYGSSGFLPGYSSPAGFLATNPGWVAPLNGYSTGLQGPVPIGVVNSPYPPTRPAPSPKTTQQQQRFHSRLWHGIVGYQCVEGVVCPVTL
jgi:hypothetical protein